MASEQQMKPEEEEEEGEKCEREMKQTENGKQEPRLDELPLQSSPYVKYSDLEEYKLHGYGTEGHLPTIDTGRHAGGTDAPTLSGTGLSDGQAAAVCKAIR